MHKLLHRAATVLFCAAALGACTSSTGSGDGPGDGRFEADAEGGFYDLSLSGRATVQQRDGGWFVELWDTTVVLEGAREPNQRSLLLFGRGGAAPLQPGTYPVIPQFGSDPAVFGGGWSFHDPSMWAVLTPESGTLRITAVTATQVRGEVDVRFTASGGALIPQDRPRVRGQFSALVLPPQQQ